MRKRGIDKRKKNYHNGIETLKMKEYKHAGILDRVNGMLNTPPNKNI
jgi:hypothetical protein